MKHIIEKINVEKLRNLRFSLPDLIVGIVIGAIIGYFL